MGQLITSLINPDGFEDWGRGEGGQPSHGAHWRRYELVDGRYAIFDTAYDQSSLDYGNDPVIPSKCLFTGSWEESESFLKEYFG